MGQKGKMVEVGNRIRAAMKAKHLTTQQLAEVMGVVRIMIYRYLNGFSVPKRGENMEKMCAALGVTENWLRYGDESVVTVPSQAIANPDVVGLTPMQLACVETLIKAMRADKVSDGQCVTLMAGWLKEDEAPAVKAA